MKYVTLEHRQSLPYGVIGCTYINFDTNDTTFENEAHELRRQRNSKQEEAKNQIIDESGQLFGTILQIKNELNNLRNGTPILKRFSKAYRTERDRLQKQVQDKDMFVTAMMSSKHIPINVFVKPWLNKVCGPMNSSRIRIVMFEQLLFRLIQNT